MPHPHPTSNLRIGPGITHPVLEVSGRHQKGPPSIPHPRSNDSSVDGENPSSERSVRRGELLVRINADHPIVVLDAPAGYGKSTLLTQMAETDHRPVSWIALNRLHDEPALLMGSLLGALLPPEELEENLLGGPLDHPAFLSSVVLPRLARLLQRHSAPALVVLDGTEALRSQASWTVLSAFLDAGLRGTTFALAGRSQPRLPLGRWVTHRRLLWLRRTDLAMTERESRSLLQTSAVAADAEDAEVAVLLDQCAGWPAALRLAAEWLRTHTLRERTADPFSGRAAAVRTYLHEAVLPDLDPPVLRFLIRASVLSELTGPLCDAMSETSGTGALLEELSRSNVPLSAIDSRSDRYRLHPLFADALTELRATLVPESEKDLHRRACLASEAEGNVEEAVRHASACGDVHLLADLVWSNVGRPRPAPTAERPLDRWLAGCPTELLRAEPRLALAAAWRALEHGGATSHWTAAAAQAAAPEPDARSGTSVRGGLALFRALLATNGVAAMIADADEAVADTGDDAWRCMACMAAGVGRRLQGDAAGASRWLSEGEQLSRLLSVPSVEAQCLAQRAALAADDEDWAAAESFSRRAVELIDRFRVRHLVTMMPSFAVSAVCFARRGDAEQAEHAALQARRLLARASAAFPTWMQLDVRILLGHAHLLVRDTAAARSVLSEAQTELHGVTGEHEFASKLHRQWQLAEELPLNTTAGRTAISPAELRVIQLLPTHLSFREIGEALYLSRNTVKTQAIAAYRKLGVNSRTEAVACARTFGLLDR